MKLKKNRNWSSYISELVNDKSLSQGEIIENIANAKEIERQEEKLKDK